MGEILDSDWSRQNLLRSDWLVPRVALYTTNVVENVVVTYGRYMYFNQIKEHHIHVKIFVHVFT